VYVSPKINLTERILEELENLSLAGAG